MPPDSFMQGVTFETPPDEAVFGFVGISVIYLIATLLALLVLPKHVKLIAAGIVTAVASIGYAGMVAGGAIVVAPTLMKLAVVLVLGGIAVPLLDSSTKTADGGTHE